MSNNGKILPSPSSNTTPLTFHLSRQGCCQSSEESPQPQAAPINPNNHNGLPHDSSRAAINQPARSVSSNLHSSRRSSVAVARPNQPIRSPSPLPKSPKHLVQKPPPWTRRQLESEREAFFDSRVTGDQEVWKALRVVCELLRKQNDEDLAEAQGILDAMGITCPTGRVASGRGKDKVKGGVYDERGVLYELPAWVIADPEDVVEEDEHGEEKPVDDDASLGAPSTPYRRDEKGKGRMEDIGDVVHVRCRLSDRGSDVTVEVGKKQQVSVLVRKIQDQVGSKRIRIMYLGKALEERKSIAETGWREGHVVNTMVFEGDEGMARMVAKGNGK